MGFSSEENLIKKIYDKNSRNKSKEIAQELLCVFDLLAVFQTITFPH